MGMLLAFPWQASSPGLRGGILWQSKVTSQRVWPLANPRTAGDQHCREGGKKPQQFPQLRLEEETKANQPRAQGT